MTQERKQTGSGKRKKTSLGRRIGRVIGIVLLCLVAVFLIFILIYHHAAAMVINNWKNPTDQKVEETAWTKGETYLEVPYAEVSSSDYLDLYVPSDTENPPLLVIIHGGGYITGDSRTAQAQKMYLYFRDHGWACASVNYRLAQEAAYPACIQDVKAAIRFLRAHAGDYGYEPDYIAVFGESAGGYLAGMAAFTNEEEFNDLPYIGEEEGEGRVSSQVQALIDYYGCVELSDKEPDWKKEKVPKLVRSIANSWLSGDVLEGYADPESFFLRQDIHTMSQEELEKVSVPYYVDENMGTAVNPKVWIAHGDSDITVPIEQSQRLYEQLEKLESRSTDGTGRVQYEVMKGAGHGSRLLYTDDELARVNAFLQP